MYTNQALKNLKMILISWNAVAIKICIQLLTKLIDTLWQGLFSSSVRNVPRWQIKLTINVTQYLLIAFYYTPDEQIVPFGILKRSRILSQILEISIWKYNIIDKDRIYREPKMFFLKKVCKQMDRITTDFVSNKSKKTPVPVFF